MNHATIQHVFNEKINAPAVIGSLTKADMCQHNHVKYLCVFCRKWGEPNEAVGSAFKSVPATDSQTIRLIISDKK